LVVGCSVLPSRTVAPVNIFGWIVVGLIAGAPASWGTSEERRGCIYTLVIGLLGALIGGAIAQAAGTEVIGDFSWRARRVAFLGLSSLAGAKDVGERLGSSGRRKP
jgi:uncharacterized membrane protein YeaQ/YmgE (transglycosylase-associated protein family)